jgi:nicotinamidase-related amidase/type 1 glutamine amidotransferase
VNRPVWKTEQWDPSKTAIIVCDMWDAHHCYNAVKRAKEMAPRMNALLHAARDRGALIIHAPSSCMDAYADQPPRRRAQNAVPAADLPKGIDQWCDQIPAEERATYPIDQSDGGEDDDPEAHRRWHEQLKAQGRNPKSPWRRQIDLLDIDDRDAVTDQGTETWNLLAQYGIDNVILCGVHTNMCVLGRPFGLRQMAKNGKHVVLIRDLTDTMYNPARWPHVNHHTGTDRIVEHIERYVCPTILSTDLLGGKPFRFSDDKRPRVAVIISEFEYETYRTLPLFARKSLGKDFKVSYAINADPRRQDLPGIGILRDADLAILSLWRRALPTDELSVIRKFVADGKPLVAIRTTCHGLMTRDGKAPEGHALWPDFDRVVLGGYYRGHYRAQGGKEDHPTTVWIAPQAGDSPLLNGVPNDPLAVPSWLYKMRPLAPSATELLNGRVVDGQAEEPVAWTNTTAEGGKVFFTSLGHPGDFDVPPLPRLLTNAVYWAAGLEVP